MSVLEVIIAMEWRVVATLYAWSEKSARMCRNTFEPYKIGVSVVGSRHVFRMVGTNAMRSMETAMTTATVGSCVKIHSAIPQRARRRKSVSVLVMSLNPYFRERRKIISVNISEAAVGSAPMPAPFASWPKNTMPETVVQTSHVYGWGFTFSFQISRRYGRLPRIASSAEMQARATFTRLA